MSDKYIFWIDDPTVLYRDGKYIEIIPTNDMTRVEQLNAMTRFFIYLSIILLLFGRFDSWIYLPIIGIIFIVILYNIYQHHPESKLKGTQNKRLYIDENFEQENQIKNLEDKVYEIQSGDTDGNLNIDKEYTINDVNGDKLFYTPDEIVKYQNATCKHPTKINPSTNESIIDFTADPPIACNSNDEDIKDVIYDNNFNVGLYRDLNDLFDVTISERMWYTVPMPSIPPDSIAFANWLYKSNEM